MRARIFLILLLFSMLFRMMVIVLGRIRKFFWHDRVFHSRRHRLKFWSRFIGKCFSWTVIIGTFSIILLYANVIGFDMGSTISSEEDVRTVYVDADDVQKVKNLYEFEMEKGFCVYGNYSRYSIQVSEIVHEDDPIEQSQDSISFTCLDETMDRLPKLLFNDSYYFIGAIHTHPYNSMLSSRDTFTFGALNFFLEVKGIYNGVDLDFFTSRSLRGELDKIVVD
jgi:hypothetical protein